MKRMKQKIAGFVTLLMLAMPAHNAQAQYYCTDAGGCGYQECRRAPCITPAVALATIALVAIIAVAVQNSSGGGAHAHQHCDCD